MDMNNYVMIAICLYAKFDISVIVYKNKQNVFFLNKSPPKNSHV